MNGCHDYQELLLEYLYDLLEEGQRQSLAAHLEGCPACQSALGTARAQQQLLAAAAKMEFPAVRFAPPAPEQPLALAPRPRRAWRRLAVAAGLLLLLGGLAAGYHYGRDYSEARATLAGREQELDLARTRARHLAEEAEDAARRRDQTIARIERDARARELTLRVEGPRSVQSGAPADYLVRTYDLNKDPAPAEVVARVVADKPGKSDRATGSALAQKAKAKESAHPGLPDTLPVTAEAEGVYRVSIPPTLRLPPDRDLTLMVSARRRSGSHTAVSEKVRLTAPVYLTHLATDRPLYQPGETVYFRSLTLDRTTLRPPQDDFLLAYTLAHPDGREQPVGHGANRLVWGEGKDRDRPVLGPEGRPVRGVGAGSFALDPRWPGGEYALTVREQHNRFPPQRCKFLVARPENPPLDKELTFNRKTYRPGDEVQARCKATRSARRGVPSSAGGPPPGKLTGGIPAKGRPVTVEVQVDGVGYGADGKPGGPFEVPTEDGVARVRFQLPRRIERGRASVSVTFHDEGGADVLTRAVPVVPNKLSVEFFPEGGDLAAGLPNRVYFQARTPLGKPADLKGVLLEDGAELPVKLETLSDPKEPGVNRGAGVFTFTPRLGHSYGVRVDSPAGIARRFALPPLNQDGVVLTIPRGVVEPGEPIRATVLCRRQRTLVVGAYCRGRLLDTVRPEEAQRKEEGVIAYEALLHPGSGAGGVCRVTVFEELPGAGPSPQVKPVAERLIYRRPAERLDVDIHPDRRHYVPGQRANVRVATTNEKERLTEALALVAVVDKGVVNLADDRAARSMPTDFLLAGEVRKPEDLEYADFLLGPHPKAARALDLLLGTQGWRRFAEQDPEEFRRKRGPADPEEVERLLVLIGHSATETRDADREKVRQVRAEFADTLARLREEHREAAGEVARVEEDEGYRAAAATVASYTDRARRAWAVLRPVLVAVLVLLPLWLLLVALTRRLAPGRWGVAERLGVPHRPTSTPWPYYALAGACAAGLVAVLLVPPPAPEGARPDAGGDVAVSPFPEPAEKAEPPEDAPARDQDSDAGSARKGARGGEEGKAKAPAPAPAAGKGGGVAPGVATPPLPAGSGGLGRPGGISPAEDESMRKLAGGWRAELKRTHEAPAKPPREERSGTPPAYSRGGGSGYSPGGPPPGGAPGGGFAGGYGGRFPGPDRLGADKKADSGDKGKGGMLPPAPGTARGPFGGAMPPSRGDFPRVMRDGKDMTWAPPLTVREYAYRRAPGRTPELRSDFAQTLYWHPALALPGGKASVAFDLPDSVTYYQVTVFAHTADGRLGAATRTFESRPPLTLRPRAPAEVTAGDRLDVPVSVRNNTPERRTATLTLAGHDGLVVLDAGRPADVSVPAERSVRRLYSFRPAVKGGEAVLDFRAKANGFVAEGARNTLKVVPDGFPVVESRGDWLEGSATQSVELPRHRVKGTLRCRLDAYPSALADIRKGLEGLLRQPAGCFEQVCSANSLNLLLLDYLKQSKQARPEVERSARESLDRGYEKLMSFECRVPGTTQRRGFEWFGGTAPPHEGLTAYGLMQLRGLARARPVDGALLKRTREYLLGRRDPRDVETFGRAPGEVSDAYVVWALTEAGEGEDLSKELTALHERAKGSKDPYFLALVANSLLNRGKTTEATALLKTVAGLQKEDGHLDASRTSVTGSAGRDLRIETTSLAVLGWLKAKDPAAFRRAADKAVRWVVRQHGESGTFGSTQSTALALKALLAHGRANKRAVEGGELRLYVGDDLVASRPFPAGAEDTLSLDVPHPERHLRPGANKVRVEVSGKNSFPYTLSWSYHTPARPGAAGCPVRLRTELARPEVREGDVVRLTARVENVSGKGQGMAVAVVGLPGGLVVPGDARQLKSHTQPAGGGRPLVSAFELRGRELVLYWRDLPRGAKVEVPVDLVARYPGVYRGPASRAYLYYDSDRKHWAEPLKLTVRAKE